MIEQSNWRQNFDAEINLAIQSRENGNEGRARVCARRAVSILIGVYLRYNHLPDPGVNAVDRLKVFVSLEQVPLLYRETAQHFLIKVDKEFNLPPGIDLITDAHELVQILNELPD